MAGHPNLERSRGVRRATKSDLFRDIASLLVQNHEVWSACGPESTMAAKNPASSGVVLWEQGKEDTILPNNRLIVRLLEENRSLLSLDETRLAQRFISHARGFERNATTRTEDVPRFPREFAKMVDDDQPE